MIGTQGGRSPGVVPGCVDAWAHAWLALVVFDPSVGDAHHPDARGLGYSAVVGDQDDDQALVLPQLVEEVEDLAGVGVEVRPRRRRSSASM